MYNLTLWQTRRWEKGSRVYAASLRQTLFGDWQVQRSWGSKGRRGGQAVTICAATYAEGLAVMDATATRRARRGYEKAGSA